MSEATPADTRVEVTDLESSTEIYYRVLQTSKTSENDGDHIFLRRSTPKAKVRVLQRSASRSTSRSKSRSSPPRAAQSERSGYSGPAPLPGQVVGADPGEKVTFGIGANMSSPGVRLGRLLVQDANVTGVLLEATERWLTKHIFWESLSAQSREAYRREKVILEMAAIRGRHSFGEGEHGHLSPRTEDFPTELQPVHLAWEELMAAEHAREQKKLAALKTVHSQLGSSPTGSDKNSSGMLHAELRLEMQDRLKEMKDELRQEIVLELQNARQEIVRELREQMSTAPFADAADLQTRPSQAPHKSNEEMRKSKIRRSINTITQPDGDRAYVLEQSTWEASILIGMDVLSFSDAAMVIIISLLNLLIQGIFIIVVATNMTEGLYTSSEIVETLQNWRVSYAHNVDFADKFTGESLGKSVCNRDPFIMQGAQQAGIYNDLHEYLQPFYIEGVSAGYALSVLAIFLWSLVCSIESLRTVTYLLAIWTPANQDDSVWNQTSSIVVSDDSDTPLQLHMSFLRRVIVTLLIVLPRLTVILSLYIVGLLYLIATVPLADLILNSVALEVVLAVDNLLFSALGPSDVISLLSKIAPLRLPGTTRLQAKSTAWLKLFAMAGWLCVVVLAILNPIVANMDGAKRVMCDGDTHFLAVPFRSGPMVVGTPGATPIDSSSYDYRSILQRTRLYSDEDEPPLFYEHMPFEVRDINTLQEWKDRAIAEEGVGPLSDQSIYYCLDNHRSNSWDAPRQMDGLPSFETATWDAVQDRTGNSTVKNCADVKYLCSAPGASPAGQTVRLTCPATCGAWEARSGLYHDLPTDGTSADCKQFIAAGYEDDLCYEEEAADLVKRDAWWHYADAVVNENIAGWRVMAGYNETYVQTMMVKKWYDGMSQGCAFFTSPFEWTSPWFPSIFVDQCNPDDHYLFGRRSVRPFCPVTCGCTSRMKALYKGNGYNWTSLLGLATQCSKCCWSEPGEQVTLSTGLVDTCISRALGAGYLASLNKTT